MLNIKKNAEGGSVVFLLEGRLDTLTAPVLEKEIMAALDGLREMTLDLEKLDYISSAGLRVLLLTYKAVTPAGELKVVNVGEPIMDILETTGFSEILGIG